MAQTQHNLPPHNNDELTVRDVVIKIRSGISYLKSKALIILIAAILGLVAGLCYAFIKKPVYIATCSFVLEEGSKGGALSQYAGLASLAGIDLGGGGSGIFTGDNIIQLYKSRTMIEKTLLCKASFNGRTELLIEKYIEFNDLKTKWRKSDQITDINFNGDPAKFSRKQDSLITDIVEAFNTKLLSVAKPDKKLSIIHVSVSTKDELFSKAFTDNLVENVNNFYVQTKTKKALQSVNVLQHQLDSVRAVLNNAIGGVASAIDATPNANPALLALRVPSQRRQVDVQASSAVYAEIVKNLELSKISLRQETPLIQIIDNPVLPLESDKPGKVKFALLGLIIGGVLTAGWLIFKKIFNQVVA